MKADDMKPGEVRMYDGEYYSACFEDNDTVFRCKECDLSHKCNADTSEGIEDCLGECVGSLRKDKKPVYFKLVMES